MDHASPLTNCMVGVDDPATAFLVKDGSVVVVQKGHGLLFAARSVFCGGAPC